MIFESCAVGTFNDLIVPCDQLSLNYVGYNGQCLTLTVSGPTHERLVIRLDFIMTVRCVIRS